MIVEVLVLATLFFAPGLLSLVGMTKLLRRSDGIPFLSKVFWLYVAGFSIEVGGTMYHREKPFDEEDLWQLPAIVVSSWLLYAVARFLDRREIKRQNNTRSDESSRLPS